MIFFALDFNHFRQMRGSLSLSPRGRFTFGTLPVFDVVDGQQRLTTFQLFIAALRDISKTLKEGALVEQLAPFLLITDSRFLKESRTERYKLHVSSFDRTLFQDLIDMDRDSLRKKYPSLFFQNGKLKESAAPLPLRAWWYFWEEAYDFISETLQEERVERLIALSAALLEDFRVIVITLDATDDAQVIFETLNSGGEPLAAMDLVRNDVFHRAIRQDEDVEELMEKRWRVFEDAFWKQETRQGRLRKPRIDFFLAHVLAAETGKDVLMTELYARYKAFVVERSFSSVDEELNTLVRHAPVYRSLVAPSGASALAGLARQLAIFDVSTAYPLVLVIAASEISDDEKDVLYGLVSSYIVRRALCGLSAKAYNLIFIRVAAHLRSTGVSRANFAAAFAEMSGDTVRFPSDSELRSAVRDREQYLNLPAQRLRYILEELERVSLGKFDETAAIRTDLTIEHVLPMTWAEHWPLPDGSKAPADLVVSTFDPRHRLIMDRQRLKHSLGNLTLVTTSGNPRLSNLPFVRPDSDIEPSKRKWLLQSLLKMNQEIAANPKWGEEEILARADVLAHRAIGIWACP